jgi:hypothetical protein
MPTGIGSWRRRGNNGRFVASRLLREERRGLVSGQPKHRMKLRYFRRSDSPRVLGRRFEATVAVGTWDRTTALQTRAPQRPSNPPSSRPPPASACRWDRAGIRS